MKILFFIIFAFVSNNCVQAQSADFILLKKHKKTVRTFFTGGNIEYVTKSGSYRNGLIRKIENDTIFIQEFVVSRMPTTIGTYILDTVGSFRFANSYKDIYAFEAPSKGFNVAGSGAALLGGGLVLTLASGVVYLADREKFSPGLLAASAGLAIAGYFMSKSGSNGIVIGKKGYRLQYIGVK